MTNQLTQTSPKSTRAIIIPEHLDRTLRKSNKGARRSIASRLSMFADWLDTTGRAWITPDLAQYRDHLLSTGKAASTINAHLSTIRSRYDDLLHDNGMIKMLDKEAAQQCIDYGWEVNPANVHAMVERAKATIINGINPKQTSAKEIAKQDRSADEFIRLTTAQANALIAAPGTKTLTGLRDTALIALALTTGARAAELCALTIGDHKSRTEDNALALLIRSGKGSKQRLVPYGDLDFSISITDAWLLRAGIKQGAIFRGFYRGRKSIRNSALTVVSVENILAQYPVIIEGENHIVRPHDLRRSYARLAWESGMTPVAIQQNLGHASLDTTLTYIGDLDTSHRQPKAFLTFHADNIPASNP